MRAWVLGKGKLPGHVDPRGFPSGLRVPGIAHKYGNLWLGQSTQPSAAQQFVHIVAGTLNVNGSILAAGGAGAAGSSGFSGSGAGGLSAGRGDDAQQPGGCAP